ncbi:hypothetical protein SMB34_00790 [Thalassospira permensis NBRC 106175]|uniref:Uncharacterized protein n=1 Tax=Thalassospira permensis NBRC 106175 TaxID=1353532 RepID=A0ABR4TTU3_9PROT|nr:hypothetical protein SMB34_00790 [Thalassospira permensis NBRC 106175]
MALEPFPLGLANKIASIPTEKALPNHQNKGGNQAPRMTEKTP